MSSPIPISPSGVSTAFQYPVDTGQGQGVSSQISQQPDDTNPPIIFEPPPALAGNDLNVEIIASGDTTWGGCEVHVSLDNTTYAMLGIIFQGDVQGVLTAAFPITGDPDTTSALQVDVTMSAGQINPAATVYTDAFLALAYVDGEIISYSNVTLTASFMYTFDTYIRRGVYGTPIANHASGASMGIITANTFRQRFPSNLVGHTLYFKFPAFNQLGLQLQALADVAYYTYTLQGRGVVPNAWYQSWSVGGVFTDFVIDTYDGNYEIFDVQAPGPLTFYPNFAGSPTPGCEVPPATAVSLPIQVVRSGSAPVTVGYLQYSPGSTAGAYNVPTTFSLATGDRIRMFAPATTDATIAGCYGTIVGSQS